MELDLATRLLASINGDKLVIFCGAGLSMAKPSNLPSAKDLALRCNTKSEDIGNKKFDEHLKENLEEIAKYFYESNQFTVFINQIVPWEVFTTEPNCGHEAIADFLTCNIIEFAVSTNQDCLIETGAKHLGQTYYACIEANEINKNEYNPLLKIHGCCVRNRLNTIWYKKQLDSPKVNQRIEGFKNWLSGNLTEKDIIIVGFWSDWSYLNEIFEKCISNVEPRSVILIDPSSSIELEDKAPDMWRWANSPNVNFLHIRESGSTFLNELRKCFSVHFLQRLIKYSAGIKESTDEFKSKYIEPFQSLSVNDLYNIRRNFCGVPHNKPVKTKRHIAENENIGRCHITLIDEGATLSNSLYQLRNMKIRLIHAAGQLMSSIKKKHGYEHLHDDYSDITICVGAIGEPSPSDLVRAGTENNIIRSGISGNWITSNQCNESIGIKLL